VRLFYLIGMNKNKKGEIISTIDANGNVTTMKYDGVGQVVSVTNAEGHTTTYEYDSRNNLRKEINARGYVTKFNYNAVNQLVETIDAKGFSVHFEYDYAGNLLVVKDAETHETNYVYDELHQKTKVILPDSSTITYSYDEIGNQTSMIKEDNSTVTYEYDALNQLVAGRNENGDTTTYKFDPVGNLTRIINPLQQVTEFNHDQLGRVTSVTDPLGKKQSYSFDAAGNVVAKTDALGTTVEYQYDLSNRLKAIKYPDQTTTSYGYDNVGNRTLMKDRTGETKYDYNKVNQVTKVSYPGDLSVQYTFDAVGNVSTLMYPDETSLSYEYDENNRLTKVTDWNGKTKTVGYNARGLQELVALPNNISGHFSYNPVGQVTDISYTTQGNIISKRTYDYNSVGNRTIERNEKGQSRHFVYDDQEQATKVVYEDGSEVLYAYDAAGNRKNLTTGEYQLTYVYDGAGRLSTIKHSQDSDIDYVFDDNGNLERKSETEFTFDFENRLIEVKSPKGTVQYVYDGDGNRSEKIVNNVQTRYIYDSTTNFPRVLVELDSEDRIITKYNDETIVRIVEEDEVYEYHLHDALGSVITITDENGVVGATYDYDVYGGIRAQEGETANTLTFTGEQWDAETELLYLRARYYDPSTGQFISKDPFPGFIHDPRSLNKYSYAYNNPINLTDPSGENPLVVLGFNTVTGIAMDYTMAKISGEEFSLGKSVKDNALGSMFGFGSIKKISKSLNFAKKGIGNKKLEQHLVNNIIPRELNFIGKGKGELNDILKNGKKMPKHSEVKNKNSLPGKGEPNSSVDLLNPNGTVKQRRYYDEKGRAKEDIDFNHPDDGTHTFPHRHKWDWSKKPPRQKPE
jgi:RHS repeat-associated protein